MIHYCKNENNICPYCFQRIPVIPVTGQNFYFAAANPISIKKVEKKLSTPYVQADLQIPVVEGNINARIKSFMNNSFENDIMEFYNQLNEAGRELRREKPYIISSTYRTTYNKNDLLSLSILYNEFDQEKRAYIKAPYNFNIKTGEAIGLKNLFKPGVDYIHLINNEIRKIPGNQNYAGISSDQPYYIDGNNLIVFLKFNAIAPTEDKLPTVSIPLSKFSTAIRAEYLN